MSAPWMPLYVADYLADTAHLSAAEHGAYLLLIMHYWRAGKLPTDERQLQRIARMSAREWANSRDTLAAFFDDEWRHNRIENEIAKSALKSNARAEAGSRGGKAKALKNNGADLANAKDLPEQKAAVALASSSQSHLSSLRSDDARERAPDAKPAKQSRKKPAQPMPDRFTDGSEAYNIFEAMVADGEASWDDFDRLGKEFTDYHAAKGSLFADWGAAFRTWVRNDRKFRASRSQSSGSQRFLSLRH